MSIYHLLMKAQAEFPSIPRGRTATVPTKSGGKYSYSYADLSDVVYACMPVLHKHHLGLIQVGVVVEGKQVLRTVIFNDAGDTINSDFLLPPTDDPQEAGASITYFRRYAECAALGIVTEDDSDASTVGGNKNAPNSGPNLKAVSNPGDFVIKVGKKYPHGKKLSECGPFDADGYPRELAGYAAYLRKSSTEKKQPLTGDFLELVEAIEAFAGTFPLKAAK